MTHFGQRIHLVCALKVHQFSILVFHHSALYKVKWGGGVKGSMKSVTRNKTASDFAVTHIMWKEPTSSKQEKQQRWKLQSWGPLITQVHAVDTMLQSTLVSLSVWWNAHQTNVTVWCHFSSFFLCAVFNFTSSLLEDLYFCCTSANERNHRKLLFTQSWLAHLQCCHN